MVISPPWAAQAPVGARIRMTLRRVRGSLSGLALRTTGGASAPAPAADAREALADVDVAASPAGAVPVTAPDGVPLHVDVDGDPGAPVTVVLCHGYLADNNFWHFQRTSLGRNARVVSYDHRGHGRSAVGELGGLNLDQLGDDLAAVLDQAVPEGPVVLVGHSMGGMAVLALAEQRPELFGDRVVGVGLVTTAAAPVNGRAVLPPEAANIVLAVIDRLRLTSVSCRALRSAALAVARGFSFASRVPPSVVDFVLQLTRSNPVHALVALIPHFLTLDKRAALPVLGNVATLVVGAEHDVTIPAEHSTAIAREVPGARLAMIPNAGHMVPLEHPALIDELLHELISRATSLRVNPA
ncbi:alpha/beta hydrolase [Saccharopolyspora sp. NPDC049426]|uniref:alpha/beta fold hydrolase n=1 Tax=Saccharopolyspora sp. NPDC049426 TaxID=3155652 RepID=UPI00341BE141